MRHTHTKRGFTLIELLIVIAIIGVLIGLLLPAVAGALQTAKITQARSDMRQVEVALRQYVTHFDIFPPTWRYTAAEGHKDYTLPEELWETGYLDGPLMDPFNPGEMYRYKAIGFLRMNGADATGLLAFNVPPNFPKSGGESEICADWFEAPVRLIIWSAGPGGSPEKLSAESPADWYPEKPNGIICLYYDGNDWLFSY